jgi:hypothetical protein
MLEKPNPEVNIIEKIKRDPHIPESVYSLIELKLQDMDNPDAELRKQALAELADSLLKVQLELRKKALEHTARLYEEKELYLKMTFELCRMLQALRNKADQRTTSPEGTMKVWDEIRNQVVTKEIANLDPDKH